MNPTPRANRGNREKKTFNAKTQRHEGAMILTTVVREMRGRCPESMSSHVAWLGLLSPLFAPLPLCAFALNPSLNGYGLTLFPPVQPRSVQ